MATQAWINQYVLGIPPSGSSTSTSSKPTASKSSTSGTTTTPSRTTISNEVDKIFSSVLGREATTEGKDFWISQVTSGNTTLSGLSSAITEAAAPELAARQEQAAAAERAAIEEQLLISKKTAEEQAAAYQASLKAAQEQAAAQLAAAAQENAAMYRDFSSQIASITADMNTPKDVSTKVKGLGNVQGGGKTLAEADLDARRGNVDKAYLGARKLQIPLANKGAAKKDVSALNVSTTQGLQI